MLVALGLPNCPWRLAYAILDTGTGPNITELGAMDPSWKVVISDVELQQQRFAAGTPFKVMSNIWLVVQIEN